MVSSTYSPTYRVHKKIRAIRNLRNISFEELLLITMNSFCWRKTKARFVRDIYYRKLGAVSWVQNCPSNVYGLVLVNSQLSIAKINQNTDTNYIFRITDRFDRCRSIIWIILDMIDWGWTNSYLILMRDNFAPNLKNLISNSRYLWRTGLT